ncbi:MAG TPA: penicillin-binding protein 2 [Pseudoneobacillus sp.]|nr:penicillin-binding protein 2 [Pseudoneobacillus sp.]
MVNTQKKKKKHFISTRTNLLFIVVFILFSTLIVRLGMVQIIYGDNYRRELERTNDIAISHSVPRGKIYDRNGILVVDNAPENAIMYTKQLNENAEDMLKVAEDLALLIEKETDKVQIWDKKDYWILRNPERAKAKITDSEMKKYENGKLEYTEIYKKQIDRITDKELSEQTEKDLEIIAIYREMAKGYALSPQIIKNKHVTSGEFARVSERLDYLPGVDTTTDWERLYPLWGTLKSILGKVSSSENGIPEEELDYYLARDYSRNDRVGLSYLEKQYEDVLQGQKAKVKHVTDKSGKVIEVKEISEGKRGNDLVLTIDLELQIEVEKIIEKKLVETKAKAGTDLLDRAFVVLIEPHTGELLTLAGKQLVKNPQTKKLEVLDFAYGTFTTSYNVGSTVKGATILTGYKTGAISPGTHFFDSPILIKETPEKSSWRNLGLINDLEALKYSSNVYMFYTAINLGKGHYRPNQPLPLDLTAFDTIRNSFSQYGLGVKTGLDLPNEQTGFKGPIKKPGLLLDLVIGQYDIYTPIQLAQYISTIANGGYRVKPHVVKEIREPLLDNTKLGPIVQDIKPTILNTIDAKEEWIDRVQEGFRRVMQENGGTAYTDFQTATYLPAGKTGTAQALYDGPEMKRFKDRGVLPPEVMNLSLAAYAPYDNPEIAMAVVVPWAYEGNKQHKASNEIGRAVLDKYFELKKKRNEIGIRKETPNQQVQILSTEIINNQLLKEGE